MSTEATDGNGNNGAQGDGLHQALLDSRQRWRELCALAADLAFETDMQGRLTFMAPNMVLGRHNAGLLGHPFAVLLAEEDAALPGDAVPAPMSQRLTWMRHAGGGTRCIALTVAPRLVGGEGPRITTGGPLDLGLRLGHVIESQGVLLTRWLRG